MKAQEVRTVAVIGAGTMGAGIAGQFARAGCQVRLVDRSEAILGRALNTLRQAQERLVEAKLLGKREAAAALARVEPLTSLEEACHGVQLLVEAVPEDLSLKRDMFKRFERLCPRSAVLATNTSGLSITRIAHALKHRRRVAWLHFINPPHLMPLVEVTKGEETSDATAKLLLTMARRLGKQPILVRRDIPGLVWNRLQFAALREALHLLAEGVASAQDIDTAMTAGPGLRYGFMGPLRIADLGGFGRLLRHRGLPLRRPVPRQAPAGPLLREGETG